MAWGPDADPQTYAIIGAALEVHTELGADFLEVGYGHALEREFRARGIPYEREVAVPMIYKGQPLGVPFRVDFVCFGEVMVELKSIPTLGKRERRQLVHYLKASGFDRGLLLNFGDDERLQVERAVGPRRLAKLSVDSVVSQAPHTLPGLPQVKPSAAQA